VPDLMTAALLFTAALALLYRWRSKYAVLAVLPLSAGAGLVAFG